MRSLLHEAFFGRLPAVLERPMRTAAMGFLNFCVPGVRGRVVAQAPVEGAAGGR